MNQANVTSPDEPTCGFQIVQSFLANPEAPDTSCAALARPVSFEPGSDVAQTWFGVDDFWGDAPATDAGPLAEAGEGAIDGGVDAGAEVQGRADAEPSADDGGIDAEGDADAQLSVGDGSADGQGKAADGALD